MTDSFPCLEQLVSLCTRRGCFSLFSVVLHFSRFFLVCNHRVRPSIAVASSSSNETERKSGLHFSSSPLREMSFNSIVNSVSGSPFNARRQRAAFVDPRWPASLGLSQKLIVDSSVGPGSSHRVVQDYEGHTGCVNALDWSENGRRLASSGDDTKICIWEESGTRYRLTESIDTGQ